MLKRLFTLILAAVLICGTAFAATYCDASKRISFYYQHDGGAADEMGTWDMALASRLKKLYGHDRIYEDKSTSKFLTGRGCGLFSMSHAYQYLLGRAGSKSEKADILYEYLSIKPVWSNTNSSMSPPNATKSLYVSYLDSMPGVTKTSVSKTFSALKSFFTGCKGCILVNAPGHFILAVGVTTYNGVEYVQVVDSIMSATIRDSRLSSGKSYDFSVTYTPANVKNYEASVHQYWLPFSQFSSKKCSLVAGFKVSSIPGTTGPMPVAAKSTLTVAAGWMNSQRITITNITEEMTYTSSNTKVCTVSDDGVVTGISAGTAQIICAVKDEEVRSTVVTVNVFDPPALTGLIAAVPGEKLTYTGTLPSGVKAGFEPAAVTEYGVDSVALILTDSAGDLVYSAMRTVVSPDPEKSFIIPDGILAIESAAFEDIDAEYIIVPESVTYLGGRVFAGSSAQYVLILNPGLSYSDDICSGSAAEIYQVSVED